MLITKQIAQKTDTKKVAQYNTAVKGLTATDWLEKGVKFYGIRQFQRGCKCV